MASVQELLEEAQKLSDRDRAEFVTELIARQNVLWLAEFNRIFGEKFNIQPVMMSPVAQTGAQPVSAPPAEEKTTFDVILKEISGAKKVSVIKALRTILPDKTIQEAKEFVEKAPQTVKSGISKEEAEKIKADLEAAGAVVEIK